MLRRLLDELLTSNRKDLETLEGLVQRQETGELAELAHRIKGAARVVRGEQLVESCRRLEDACLSPNASFAWVEECAVGVKLAILALDGEPGGRVHGLTWSAPVARAVNQSSSLCPRIGHVQARKRLHSGWGAFSAEPDQRSEYRPRGHPSRFLRSDSPSGVR